MNATDCYTSGRLPEAIEAQVREVKANPADPARRTFLFELLAFAGDLDRARKQLDAVRYDDPALETAVAGYRQLLEAERARRRVFRDGTKPQFFTDPPEHVALRLEAVGCLRENRPEEAAGLLRRAAEVTPVVAGRLNDKPFESLRDCDDLFAGVLEVMAHGTYFWLPLEQVCSLSIAPPRFPRDLLWVPARLEMEESQGNVFLPALYPGSHEHPDAQVRLGRMTDWAAGPDGTVLGVGLRTFLVDDDAVSLLEWRTLER
jgi:type VI secretion system protein ImpE